MSVYWQMARQAVADAKHDSGTWYPVGIDCDQCIYDESENTFTVGFNGDYQEIEEEEKVVDALIRMWRQHDEDSRERYGYEEDESGY